MGTIPESFWQLQKTTSGWNQEAFEKILSQKSPVSIRVNPRKMEFPLPSFDRVPWSQEGCFLKERPLFAADPYWHGGAYYVQEANSMFTGWLVSQLDLGDSPVVLDLCAAPGGKSTHLAALIPENGLLVSNEVIQARVSVLNENFSKWGYPGIITNSDPSHFAKLTGVFDLIVVDAPCSGEGLFRRDPESINEWSTDNVKLCCERQQRILAQIWPALKEGGILIYSTCTYNTKEDEENLEWLKANCQAEVIDIKIPASWGIHSPSPGAYKFFPWNTQGEGFFAAIVRKTSEESEYKTRTKGFPKQKGKHPMADWLQGNYSLVDHKERVIAMPENHLTTLEYLQQQVKIVKSGLEVGTVKGKDLIPSHELALSVHFNKSQFESCSLNYLDTVAYLKKELNDLPDTSNGWKIIEFENLPLGFAKKIGNRINNYFPQEWRLRMQVEKEETPWWK
jgi:16S rRNA C967 or C1407 C5-methylase (RsmB/RsmF family)/NOL1/NOP2/fmu family ribosome biogenesis protein